MALGQSAACSAAGASSAAAKAAAAARRESRDANVGMGRLLLRVGPKEQREKGTASGSTHLPRRSAPPRPRSRHGGKEALGRPLDCAAMRYATLLAAVLFAGGIHAAMPAESVPTHPAAGTPICALPLPAETFTLD